MQIKYNFNQPILELLTEKLIVHKEELKNTIVSADYDEKIFYHLKGKYAATEDLIQLIIEHDRNVDKD